MSRPSLTIPIQNRTFARAKMCLVDYISCNPYQAVKTITKFDEEFMVANLSRIQTDVKLVQIEKSISGFHLNKFYLDSILETQEHTTQQPIHNDQISNKDPALPLLLTHNLISPANQITTSKIMTKVFLLYAGGFFSVSMFDPK